MHLPLIFSSHRRWTSVRNSAKFRNPNISTQRRRERHEEAKQKANLKAQLELEEKARRELEEARLQARVEQEEIVPGH
jgi:hypothetical protein